MAVGANAPLHKTGDWRVFRPVLHPEKCNGCRLCFVYCPDAAISMTDKDRPVIDYDHWYRHAVNMEAKYLSASI
ncbi:MAG: 4Fe-4S binding protein [Nitrospirae bacterium]|nr:4Fe-4S binding protein [Nitrospirota bacterium]